MPNLHQLKSEQMRERLIQAALDLIQERGFASLSMNEVAKAAGVTTGAVQHHFSNKAELMLQIIRRLVQSLALDDDFWPEPSWPLALRAEHFVQQAWGHLYGKTRFVVAWEAYLGVRLDASLVEQIQSQRSGLYEQLHTRFVSSFPEWVHSPDSLTRFQLVLSCLRGLGIVAPFSNAKAIDAQLHQLSRYLQSLPSEVK